MADPFGIAHERSSGFRRTCLKVAAAIAAALVGLAMGATPALADVYESEPNNSFETANSMPFSEYIHGNVTESSFLWHAEDYFRVNVPSDGNMYLWLKSESRTGSLRATLYDANMSFKMEVNSDSDTTTPRYAVIPLQRGTYYIGVGGWSNGPYHVWLTLPFTDAKEDTPHYTDILYITQKGITTGFEQKNEWWPYSSTGRKEFRPYANVQRQDMAAFLFRLAQTWNIGGANVAWQPSDADKAKFIDVNSNTPHAREIWWLASRGISNGWDAGNGRRTFRGSQPVTRQDMAAFLFRLAKLAGKGGATDGWSADSTAQGKFYDVNAKTPHAREIWWLANKGISNGWDAGNGLRDFRGMSNIARADMAAFLHRLGTM